MPCFIAAEATSAKSGLEENSGGWRVVPSLGFKFASRLQQCQAKAGAPALIRIETSAGHGAGTALSKMIEEVADEWAFLVKTLGMGD